MEEVNEAAWHEIVGRCEEVGVDGFEINFSCPHGMPERKMGMAMGQDPELLQQVPPRPPRSRVCGTSGVRRERPLALQVCGWVDAVATKPVWAKMTPNITDIAVPARAALTAGMEGVAAINTLQSVMGINLTTLRPEPSVEGHTTLGGYSSKAVKPIALAKCMQVSQMMRSDFPADRSLSGIGGVERGGDAAEFILLGASTVQACALSLPHAPADDCCDRRLIEPHVVQVCTGVMLHGYGLVKHLCGGLQQFMAVHDFESIEAFRGAALPYFTTHSHLHELQSAAISERRKAKLGLSDDAAWTGDGFVDESESMVSNK